MTFTHDKDEADVTIRGTKRELELLQQLISVAIGAASYGGKTWLEAFDEGERASLTIFCEEETSK